MGYACPVCETPQPDAEHLANHLAFAAMLHGGAHRTWLDDNAPGWADEGPAALGERVAPLSPEATYEAVFEDTVHDPGRPFADGSATGVPSGDGRTGEGTMDETTRAALAEAREMTRRARAERAETGGLDAGTGDDTAGDGDDTAGDGDDTAGDGDDTAGDGEDDRGRDEKA